MGIYNISKRTDTVTHHLHGAVQKFAERSSNRNLPLVEPRRLKEAPVTSHIIPPKSPDHGIYDVVVLGAGPAGLTAGLFAARAGLSVLVLGSDAGSLSEAQRLENYPGWPLLEGGPRWLQTTKRQAVRCGATFARAGLLVENIRAGEEDNYFALEVTGDLRTSARSVVVATGAKGRRLGLRFENLLWGKYLHSCAVCDGSSYVDRVVVVVGGGDAAVDGALLLARYAKQVILVHRRPELRATNARNVKLLWKTPNILVQVPYTIRKLETYLSKKRQEDNNAVIEDHHVLIGVELQEEETNATIHISCDGVFELIGSTPNTDWLKGSSAELDTNGFITLSNPSGESRTATTMDGVFAAGEVTDQIYRQAITAAAEGAEAAMDAERWLRNHPVPEYAGVERSESIPLQIVPMQGAVLEQNREQAEPIEPKSPEEDDCDLTQEECIRTTVDRYPVVVFSKPWCPYCRKAMEALAAEGLPEGNANLLVVDLTLLGDKTRVVQGTLQSMTGRLSVPNVFVGGTSIGGGDETINLHREGKLHSMLVFAKAIEGAVQKEDSPCDDLSQETCITQLINRYPVVVFSKPGCPHCRRAIEALALEGLPEESRNLHVVDLRSMQNMQQIQDRLESMTGQRTVPNVFVGGSSIGGGSETVQFQKIGKLRTMLAEAHAIEVSR